VCSPRRLIRAGAANSAAMMRVLGSGINGISL
jgi:hypothetical protein